MKMERLMQNIQQAIEACDARLAEGNFSYGRHETDVKMSLKELEELLTECGFNSLSDKHFLFYANNEVEAAMQFGYTAGEPLLAPLREAREMLQQAWDAINV